MDRELLVMWYAFTLAERNGGVVTVPALIDYYCEGSDWRPDWLTDYRVRKVMRSLVFVEAFYVDGCQYRLKPGNTFADDIARVSGVKLI